jgi:monofunctional biosynthetic peptidoglycan transglycosylase
MTDTLPSRSSTLALESGGRARMVDRMAVCLRIALVSGSRMLIIAALLASALAVLFFLVFRFVDPPASALMIARQLGGQTIDQRWVPLELISPNLIRAVIIAEDGQFCRHRGVDLKELEAELKRAERVGNDTVRGASTISMQVTKNLLLWQSRSYLRKGLELALAIVMELIWPKERILEVYLNIAEWGPGIFGAEAAARHHFRKPAARLTSRESALLAAALPNPFERVAGRPGPGTWRLAILIEGRARAIGNRSDCIPRS